VQVAAVLRAEHEMVAVFHPRVRGPRRGGIQAVGLEPETRV